MNPWNVNSVSDFNFLCCPECVFRSKEQTVFETHAIKNHPLASTLFSKTGTFDSMQNNYCESPEDKSEITEYSMKLEADCDNETLNNDKVLLLEPQDIKYESEHEWEDEQDTAHFTNEMHLKISKCDGIMLKATCIECDKVFCNKVALQRHTRKVHKEKNKSQDTKAKMVKCKHSKRPINCDECPRTFKTKESLSGHLKLHTRSTEHIVRYIYHCCACNETFEDNSQRVKHEQSVHPDLKNNRECSFCKNTFKSHINLRQHVSRHHDCVECGLCNKLVPRHGFHKRHIKEQHLEVKLNCDHCSYTTTVDTHLRKHRDVCYFLLTTNSTPLERSEDGKVKCPTCSLELQDHQLVNHHQHIHGCLPPGIPQGKKYICEHCSREFLLQTSLGRHVKKLHLPSGNKEEPVGADTNIKCDECGTICFNKGFLVNHYRRVHKSFPSWYDTTNLVPCTICGDMFKKHLMSYHIQRVHSEKPVEKKRIKRRTDKRICETCGKVFSNNDRCRMHVLSVHMNHNPYKCPECPMKFPVPGRLKSHMNVKHTRLTCDICQVVVYNAFNMKEHNYKVHGIMPKGALKCDQCDKIFMKELVLKKHKASKH